MLTSHSAVLAYEPEQQGLSQSFNIPTSPFPIQRLTSASKAYMALHQHVVYENGRKGKGHHTKHWLQTDVWKHFMAGHLGLGVMDGKKMVGQLLLTKPDNGTTKYLEDYPFDVFPKNDTMVIQSLGVHLSKRGKYIAENMLERACEEAALQGKRFVIGKTSSDNAGGIGVFSRAGFNAVSNPQTTGKPHPVYMVMDLMPAEPMPVVRMS